MSACLVSSYRTVPAARIACSTDPRVTGTVLTPINCCRLGSIVTSPRGMEVGDSDTLFCVGGDGCVGDAEAAIVAFDVRMRKEYTQAATASRFNTSKRNHVITRF